MQLLTDLNTNGGTGGAGGAGTPSGSSGAVGIGGNISLTNSNTGTFTVGAATEQIMSGKFKPMVAMAERLP